MSRRLKEDELMTRCWITTHWPPLIGRDPDLKNIHVQDKHKDAVRDLRPGDKVFFYEFKGGPNVKVVKDGSEQILRRQTGREAVVSEMRVTSAPHERPGYVAEEFVGKGSRNFRWEAR